MNCPAKSLIEAVRYFADRAVDDVMSRVVGRRITWRQLCEVDGAGFMGLE
jgi:hypothetical protein